MKGIRNLSMGIEINVDDIAAGSKGPVSNSRILEWKGLLNSILKWAKRLISI
jgi:hypothetical protein